MLKPTLEVFGIKTGLITLHALRKLDTLTFTMAPPIPKLHTAAMISLLQALTTYSETVFEIRRLDKYLAQDERTLQNIEVFDFIKNTLK